jgi:predicted nucleic acid-binding protein
VIRFLIDSSALWRVQREKDLRMAWAEVISAGAVGSCHPQRVEFKRSARGRADFDAMTEMFEALYPDLPVPKSAWRWVESTQYRLTQDGTHRGLSVAGLLISATAAHHGVTVLHDDQDFATVARTARDVRERSIRAIAGSLHSGE